MLAKRLPTGPAGDSIRGDLREEYNDVRQRRGRLVANVWFTIEAARLVVSLSPRARTRSWIETAMTNLRLAARSLIRAPGFTALTVLTLTLGLGANTTIFGVARSVVIEPLPFEHVDRVVAARLGRANQAARSGAASFPLLLDLQDRTMTPELWGGWRSWQAALTPTDGGPPLRINAAGATHTVFDVLGLPAEQGRVFTAEDEVPGNPQVAVVSHGFWRGYLGSDPEVLNRSINVNQLTFRVVGVLPESFRGETSGPGALPPADVDVWVPYRNSPVAEGIEFRGLQNVNAIARLPDARRLAEAQAELDAVMADLANTYDEHEGDAATFIRAQEVVVGEARSTVWLLLGSVSLVLLLACVNAASLVLGRVNARSRELAVRRALGAGRRQLLGLLLAESAILVAVGGAAAAGVTILGLRLLRTLDPGTLPRLQAASVDGPTLAFLGSAGVLVVLLLGVIPAWQASRTTESPSMQAELGRSRRSGRLRPVLVATQVALATVLFGGSLLLVRSLERVLAVEPGFDATGLLTARIDHPTPFVSDEWPEHVAFFEAVVAGMRQLPGVEAAAAAYQDPADPGWNNSFSIVGEGEDLRGAIFRPVSPGYFGTAGIELLEGRDFSPADNHDASGVAIVNRAFVDRYFPDGEALGRRVDYGDFWQARANPEYAIVGVVENVRFTGIESDIPPAIYFPHAQQPVKEMALVARTTGDPLNVVPQLRRVVADLNPTLPVFDIGTVSDKLSRNYAERRFVVSLLAAFAFIALSLATVGLYGVLAFFVSRRRKEIGVRMAVGASVGSVRAMVLRQGMLLVGSGLAVGVVAVVVLGRLMNALLFEISPADATTLVTVFGTIVATGLVACLVPARRATRVDPLEALNAD